MPLQDPILEKEKFLCSIQNTLSRVQVTLGLDNDGMADLLELKTKEFVRIKEKRIFPKVTSIMALSRSINVGFDALMEGALDYRAIASYCGGETPYLRERYSVAAFTKNRVATNFLDHIEFFFGWEERAHLLRYLQLTEDNFSDPDQLINMRFSVDVIEWIYKKAPDERIIENIGRELLFSVGNEPWLTALQDSKNLHELFERMFSGVLARYLESNFSWSIHSMDSRELTLRGTPCQQIIEHFGDETIKSQPSFFIRKGIFSAIPRVLGYPFAAVKMSEFFGNHRNYCELRLDIDQLTRYDSQRARA